MAVKKKRKSLALKLRNYFFTGVVVLIPIGFTLYLTKFLIGVSSKLIPTQINPNTYLMNKKFILKNKMKMKLSFKILLTKSNLIRRYEYRLKLHFQIRSDDLNIVI